MPRFFPGSVTGVCFLVGCSVLIAVFFGSPCGAEEKRGFLDGATTASSETPVEIYALKIIRDETRTVLSAEGAVDIKYGELRLQADRVVLNEITGDLEAFGNARLEQGEDYLTGEELRYNFKQDTGVVYRARGFLSENYVKGEEIQRISENEYMVFRGSVTACEQEVPDWKFSSPKTRVVIGDYLYTHHPTMWVKRLPVLYLPYLVIPLKTERATGLLIPKVSYSETNQFVYKQDFFWVLADNMDVTIGGDYYQKKGIMARLEGRYVFSENTGGEMKGSWIDDYEEKLERWRFEWDHHHDFGRRWRGVGRADLVSDVDYAAVFQTELEDRTQEDYEINTTLKKTWENLSLTISADYDRNLEQDYERALLPQVSFDLAGTSLFGGGPTLGGSLVATRFETGDILLPDEQIRVHADPKMSWPIHPGPYLTVTPKVVWYQTWYRKTLADHDLWRSVAEGSLTVDGPDFFRIYGKEEGVRYRHRIEPQLVYRYREEIDQEDIYRFDVTDQLGEISELRFNLVNRLTAKRGSDRPRDVARFDLSQRYDFLAEDEESADAALFPLEIELDLNPLSTLRLTATSKYRYENMSFPQKSFEISCHPGEKFELDGEIRQQESPEIYYLGLGGDFDLGKGWSFNFKSRYDLAADEKVENRIGLGYKSQCWEIRTVYYDRPDDYEFEFKVILKNIGTVLTI